MRVEVRLAPVEQALLRCWWVRRLGFIAHAGAASISTAQTYSRLEHSLGLLALVVQFTPNDQLARAAALLHDIGHLPLSHTFEGVAGLNHHQLGEQRIKELGPVLSAHSLEAEAVIDVVRGARPSVLQGETAALRLDHLDSFMRSGRVHGRTREPPPITLGRLRIVDGAVETDEKCAGYLAELVVGEALSQSAAHNLVATGVLRHLATRVVIDLPPSRRAEIAAMTDHEFWALLLADRRTSSAVDAFRRDPAAWQVAPVDQDDTPDAGREVVEFQLSRLYLDLPLVNGQPMPVDASRFAGLPKLPQRYLLKRHP